MIELKGTHGTCTSFAQGIRQNGFVAGAGRRGHGVYFWAYSSTDQEYATALAKAWWAQAKSMRRYDREADQSCSVLYVKINAQSDKFLDLEEHGLKQKLLRFLNDVYKRTLPKGRESLAKSGYDLFLKMYEKEVNKHFDVIYVTVNPPKSGHWDKPEAFPPFDMMGLAPCYVVRDKGCIVIT